MGAELSHSKNVPVQVDGNDLLLSGLGAIGALSGGVPIPFGPYGAGALAAAAGNGYLPGYARADKTQFQVNAIKVGRDLLGAQQYLLIGEAGFQWADLDDSL